MIAKGSELIFISRIKADGSEVIPMNLPLSRFLEQDDFELIRLSISQDTYIAVNGFYSYVVRKKQAAHPPSRKEGEQ